MNKRAFYINCGDENATAIYTGPGPSEDNGLSALMVNPKAGKSVLIDAAFARANRICAVTAPFNFIAPGDLDEIPTDVLSRFFITINSMSHEVVRLCEAAQFASDPTVKETSHE